MTTAVDAPIPAEGAAAVRGRAPTGRAGPRRRLFAKYAAALVGLVSLVLLVNGSLNVWFSYDEARDAAIRLQREKAQAAAQRIEEFIAEIEKQIGWTTATQWASAPIEQRRFDYGRLLRQVPAITELIQLDSHGREQLKVSRLAIDVVGSGADYAADPRFTGVQGKKMWFGPVYFRKESEPYMTMALAHSGRNAGVTVAEVNLKLIWDVITAIKIGKTGYAYVVDNDGRLIAHPDISRVLRNTDLSGLPQVGSARGTPGAGADPAAIVRNLDGHRVLSASAAIPKLGWHVFVEQPLSEALAPLFTTVLNTALLLVLGLAVAILAGLLLARRMTGPIRELDAGAARIGAGALGHRIDVRTGDELEELAERFNAMAADLQSSYADLEKKVEDRTAELTEALDQQTATAEVLGVINSSPGDLAPVFDAMLEKATRLCEADFGIFWKYDGERFYPAALRGVPQAYAEFAMREPLKFDPESGIGRIERGESLAHYADLAAESFTRSGPLRTLHELGGIRSLVAAPLRRDAVLLGIFVVYRQEVRPFTDRQIALLQNFAAQAVIAMENARLITETREALEQQTATAEVLGVINSSPGDLVPVFDAMLDKAMRLCNAAFGYLMTYDGERFQEVAHRGLPPRFAEYLPRLDQPGPSGAYASIKAGAPLVHIADLKEGDVYLTSPLRQALVDLGGARTSIIVALRKDEALLGVLTIYRQEIRPFSEKQIALLENFAAQAVIAMENARLITETREALEQQTATAEVLGVINSSPGNLAPVFDAMLDKAMRLCGAVHGTLTAYDGEYFWCVASHNLPHALFELLSQPRRATPNSPQERLLRGERIVHIADMAEVNMAASPDDQVARAAAEIGFTRTVLFVPLRKDNTLLGYIGAQRHVVRPFTDKQIAMLENFAAQAVIAMENARLITETREALDRQTATSEVLGIISSSPGRLEPVFDVILASAVRVCAGKTGMLALIEDGGFRGVAVHGVGSEFASTLSQLHHPPPATGLDLLQKSLHSIQIADCAAEPAYDAVRALNPAFAVVRTALHVPMIRDAELLGAILIYRDQVRPFDDKEVELVENFAKQAVIAIENTRLITEIREALEQQTATAEVLGVINSSPGDVAPVFDAILEKAHTLCGAAHGSLTTYDGEHFRAVALRGMPAPLADLLRQPFSSWAGGSQERLLQGDRLVHIPDITTRGTNTPIQKASIEAGIRTLLIVPLRKDDALLGYITANRREVRPFSDKQIALLENFAAQAVIAMENARLITETHEALEQQTATAEVLQVINSSPGDLTPVFDAMLDKAIRLCEATHGHLFTYDGERFHYTATRGEPHFIEWARQAGPVQPYPNAPLGRIKHGEQIVHVVDIREEEVYRVVPIFRESVELRGVRSQITVALLKDNALLGAMVVYRQEVRPFTDKQIALLENFAAQAVIAMENARLITETREALEQQTATAEVLGVINSSPGDLAPVFEVMLEKATSLCEAAFGVLLSWDGEGFHRAAWVGAPAELIEATRAEILKPAADSLAERFVHGERVISIDDLVEEERYRHGAGVQALVRLGGARSYVGVALRKDDSLLGVIAIYRQEVRPFTDKQIALLQNFAAQAVIAMENARLITETREALEQQTATAEVLGVINSSPGDLAPVFDAMLEKAVRLCDAAFGILWTYDGELFHAARLRDVTPAFAEFLREPTKPVPGGTFSRLLAGEPIAEAVDIAGTESYRAGTSRLRRAFFDLGGAQTALFVALRKDQALLGAFTIYRKEIRPFTDKQTALVTSFAAQAVIAMENARLITETREALEQQTATAEVLGVINSSPGDLAPVFDAILDKAQRVCGVDHAALELYDGERFHAVAVHGASDRFAETLRHGYRATDSPAGRALLEGRRFAQIADASQIDHVAFRTAAEVDGMRTVLFVPLRRDDALLGMIASARREVRPFSEKEIALLENFAAQAVIAMENARLITELRQRTGDLQEFLEYQTATSEVLKVISQSGADLEPVLEMLVETAARLCDAEQGYVYRLREGRHHLAASFGLAPEFKDFMLQNPFGVDRGTLSGRTLLERRVVHIEDAANDPEYTWTEAQQRGNLHTGLGVPLLREDTLVGVLGFFRSRVEPFTEKQIALVTTFADQAVIAIENARLLGDLQRRTHDLQESLEYQTATSDVLKVISQSTFDLQPVLATLAETAARLCDAEMAFIFRRQGDLYRVSASVGFSPETKALVEANPISPGRGTVAGRTALTASVVHIPDARLDPEYTWGEFVRVARTPTMLGVPLLREGVPVGVIVLARQRVEPFTEKQIALVSTFADQAVIAIENARLFNELRDRTAELGRSVEELKMLSDVGQAVSSTLDLRSVLSTILTSSLGLTVAKAGAIFRYSRAERAFRLVEAVGWDEALTRSVEDLRLAETETAMGEAVARRTPIQLADTAQRASNPLRDLLLAAGFHSALIVPLVGAERILGAIILMRQETGEFPSETVRLMQTLASQSVMAIQNARLFREIADKSEQLALASQHKSQFLANMSHELRTPLNAILGYAELLVDGIYGQLPERPSGVLERIQNNGRHLLALINDVLDLAKIEAGQLTLTLEDYALAEVVRSVVTATEPLATSKGLKFTAAVQDAMPMAHGDARRVSQVLLNLVGNAIKFTDTGEVEIRAASASGQFELTVRDTGPGIPDADQDRIFGEFQQIDNSNTRQKGGTGLGLAISKRMVEMQGGTIAVESVLGEGSTFRVVLPVHVDEMMEAAE